MRRRGTWLVVAALAGIGLAATVDGLRGETEAPPPAALQTATGAEKNTAEEAPTVPGVPEVDYVIDLNTGVMTPLPQAIIRSLGKSGERGPYLSWTSRYAASPDGSLLAYVGIGDEGSAQIFIAGVDGTGVRQMTHDAMRVSSPAWSPDGTMIAYLAHPSGGVRNLFVLDVATGESNPIADVGRVQPWSQLQFTPDGSSLLYSGGSDQYAVLRTIPIDGGKSTVLIGPDEGMGHAANGSLSPDGSLVTMMGNEINGPGAIRFVANADGTERRSIPEGRSNPAGTWSPDGNRIVCSDYDGKNILVVDIGTGAASRVAKGSGAIWLNRHTLLVEVTGAEENTAEEAPTAPTPSSIGLIEGPAIGRHAVTEEGVTFSFRVWTYGWERFGSISTDKSARGPISINKSILGPQGAEAIIFWTSFPDGDYADPCSRLLSPRVGPSAGDLAAAVATAPGTELVKGPSDVTVGGRPAKHVVLIVRENVGCDPGFFYTWRDVQGGALWPTTNVGDTIRVWIVDVGGTLLFIEAETTQEASFGLRQEIQQIVQSIRFD